MVNNSHPLILAIGLAVLSLTTHGLPHDDLSATEILERQLKQLSPGSAAELTLHKSLGNLYKNDGQYEEAISHYESARGLAAHLGDGAELASTLQSLGLVKLRQGHLLDARAHFERAHALLDTESTGAVEVMHNLGNVRREMGHFDAALGLYEKAKKMGSSVTVGPEEVSNLQVDIGETFARRGDLDKALPILQQALKAISGARDVLSESSLAVSQSTLGAVHHAKGDLTHADGLYTKALKIQTRILRSGHPDLVATQMRKSRLLRDLGDHDAAVSMASSVEESLRLTEKGPDLISCLVWKSDLLREESRVEEAELAIEEALTVHEQCCSGFDSPDAAVAVHTYGSILHDQGRLDAAVEKYKKALDMNLQTVGLKHPETAAAHNSLGTVYQDMGDDVRAEVHFAKCLEIQLQTVGTESPEVSNTYNNLATILFRRGSLSDAKLLFEKALQVMDAAGVPPSNPDRVVYAENLSEVIAKLEAPQGAEVI